MKVLVLFIILAHVYGFYKKRDMKPEIPDDKLADSIHNGPVFEEIMPIFKHNNKDNILTGESLYHKHRDRLRDFIGTNILPPNKGPNNGNHYYKGDNDKSVTNKYKRWYRSPRFPDSKGVFPSKRKEPTARPTVKPTEMPTNITSAPTILNGPTFIPTNTPTISPIIAEPTLTPTITPTETPTSVTVLPTMTPSISPVTTAPTPSCNFVGEYAFLDDNNTDTGDRLHVCETNGSYALGFENGLLITGIARGEELQSDINGQTLTVNEVQLATGQLPCFDTAQESLSCVFDTGTFQYGNSTLQKLTNDSDPLICLESTLSFNDYIDPMQIVGLKTSLLHLIGFPSNSITGCVLVNGTSCDYSTIYQLFDDTVRIGCLTTDSCPRDQSSIFVPFDSTSLIGVTQWINRNANILTGTNVIWSIIMQNTTLTCPLS